MSICSLRTLSDFIIFLMCYREGDEDEDAEVKRWECHDV